MATKLYVANLPFETSEAELQNLFGLCGPVSELDIIKNYAFIHMGTNEAAQKAVADYNNLSFKGNIISVQFSKIQNVNRGNKYMVKYDRPDRIGRGGPGFGNRGGFHGDARGGFNFRGRGGFRGGRGGPDNFHRGKPYDRNHSVNQVLTQVNLSNNSNLQSIRPVGSDNPMLQTQIQPVQPQANVPTQPLNNVVQTQIARVQTIHQSVPVALPNNAQILHQNIMPPNRQFFQQPASYQPVQSFGDVMTHGHAAPQQMSAGLQHHIITPVVASMVQPVQNMQPSVQAQAQLSANMPQQGPGNQAYTVYERYVDYRHPGEMGQVQGQVGLHQGPPAVSQVYQAPVATNKDPYANAQMMYERQAVATSRAAIYANAYYGNNTGIPAANVMQGLPVASPNTVVQPIQLHYQ